MGDMGDIFKLMTERNKERRAKNLKKADTARFTRHTEYHFSTMLQGKRLDYWPSGNKWRWKNKNYYGDIHGFIKNRS